MLILYTVFLNVLKVLGLYLDTLRNSHTFCNELTLQKDLQNYITNNVFWTTSKNQQQIKTANIKILAKAGNLGLLTPKSCALPLDHRDNLAI